MPVQVDTRITITRLTSNIGAEIGGVDASQPLSDETVATLRQALLRHKVIFLRGQQLEYDIQVRFAQRFGELTPAHPIYRAPGNKPHLRTIEPGRGYRENHWHVDFSYMDRPPAFPFLHFKVVPEVGGDTIWANAVTAYESMPAWLRATADGLRITHSNNSDYTDDTHTPKAREDFISTPLEVEHPAVRVHPETGERALLLGGFARSVADLSPKASRALIEMLQDYVTRPEHTVRWKWRTGDLAIWDNQATQHYAVFDYGAAPRRGERVAVAGPVPVGVDGRPSVVLRSVPATNSN
jgi:taurine dioxygenase